MTFGRVISSPRDVFELVADEIRSFDRAKVKLISLDHQNILINCEMIYDGSFGITLLHPRKVFETAFKNSATFIILVHNHPSGSPEPSESDIEVTKKLVRIGKMVGVHIQDHVIVGNGGYKSLRARRIGPSKVKWG